MHAFFIRYESLQCATKFLVSMARSLISYNRPATASHRRYFLNLVQTFGAEGLMGRRLCLAEVVRTGSDSLPFRPKNAGESFAYLAHFGT